MPKISAVVDRIMPMLQKGLTYKQIGALTGMARSTISYQAIKAGMGKPQRKHDWTAINRFLAEGGSIQICCEQFGVSESTLYKAMNKDRAPRAIVRTEKNCLRCGVLLIGKWQRKFCTSECSRLHEISRAPYHACQFCGRMFKSGWRTHVANCDPNGNPNRNSRGVLAWKRRLKDALVDAFGGKCRECGYAKCRRSLTFHHLDPLTKSFTISGSNKNNRGLIFEEAKKCTLLCMNCHGEVHEGVRHITIDDGLKQVWKTLGSAPQAVC